ncbi:lipase family protein [Mycolicibacterium litorale]|uniref:Secretory lipase family protein n=1 Tax=Mycolicibacterium litorale TaxID=758802 RepID=A0AAD1IPG4_9MYCO|nr:lipase family protein [Mycolicibacterium litorale]TDY09269.1 triacylglycerol lipase [Mycolicibacterium litorale]BBY17212.1 secretory lipase family protein [Mycolicibacterium litorale]
MGRGIRVLFAVVSILVIAVSVSGIAAADDPTIDDHHPYFNEDEYQAFYTPPEPLPPGAPGDLIRTEPSRLVLEPSGALGMIMANGTRIMYRSNDARGKPVAVTGTYFEPHNPWPHPGPRPLIVYGPGTQGQGDQCAPSRQFNQGIHWAPYLDIAFNYEELFVATMVARGFAIVMTDYEGLGTPGLHTYVSRVSQGHAMLDAARAAKRLPGTSLKSDGPVAFWGYSQGGGAAASAAEMAQQYAPELGIVGTYAGAPPADLKALFPFADGSMLVGVVGYALNSVMTAYPEHEAAIRATLTPRGTDMLFKVQDQCVAETISKFMFRHLQPYFNQDIHQLVEQEPFKALFDEQKLGRSTPNAPVLINANRFDPLVPWAPAMQLGRDWCAQGADVEARTNEQPPFLNKAVINHALPMLVDGEPAMQWITDRFKGVPTAPNCGRF